MPCIHSTYYGTRATRRRERREWITAIVVGILLMAFIWFVLVIF